jgi:hypothetical protein
LDGGAGAAIALLLRLLFAMVMVCVRACRWAVRSAAAIAGAAPSTAGVAGSRSSWAGASAALRRSGLAGPWRVSR